MRGKKKKKASLNNGQNTTGPRSLQPRLQAERVNLKDALEICTPFVLNRVGSDLSFIEVAEQIEPSTLLDVTKG